MLTPVLNFSVFTAQRLGAEWMLIFSIDAPCFAILKNVVVRSVGEPSHPICRASNLEK